MLYKYIRETNKGSWNEKNIGKAIQEAALVSLNAAVFKYSFPYAMLYRHEKSLLLAWRYNSGRVLAFSTFPFHMRRSWTYSVHFMGFIFFRSFLTSSSHWDLGLPVNGFHLCIFFTILVSGILFMCPNQLNLWALT